MIRWGFRTPLMIVIVLGSLVMLVICLEGSTRSKDREAQMRASLRVISSYNVQYVHTHNMATDDYLNGVRALGVEHGDLEPVRDYVAYAEEEAERAAASGKGRRP